MVSLPCAGVVSVLLFGADRGGGGGSVSVWGGETSRVDERDEFVGILRELARPGHDANRTMTKAMIRQLVG